MLFKKFIPIYHPSKYMRVSDTVTVPIWRWKCLFLWSLNLHLFVMNEAEYIFTCFKEIPLWNKNKQFLFLFCEVCLYDLCLVSIGLLFSYWFFLYILLKHPFFICHKYFISSILFALYFDALFCSRILLYTFKFVCFISYIAIFCHVFIVLPCIKIVF